VAEVSRSSIAAWRRRGIRWTTEAMRKQRRSGRVQAIITVTAPDQRYR
jgi:hypothetical protein